MSKKKLVSMKNIVKNFGGVQALNNVDFDIYENEVVGLLGDNGAGKSTLVKILCGVYKPTKGEIYLKGKKVDIANPREARKYGIEIIYQDLALVEEFSVTENIFLGKELKKRFMGLEIFDIEKMKRETKKALNKLKINMPNINQQVYYLSGGQRESIAISRAVYSEKDIQLLIMDEPTASLGIEESGKVKELIRHLKETQRIAIVIISHNLEEVFDVCDRAVVLCGGNYMGERHIEKASHSEIVQMIMGSKKNN